MADGAEDKGNIPTNLRLLMVLEEMASAGVPVTPTEVNRELGLPKPTIHRLFTTLESEGFIQRDIDGRAYSPGRRLRSLSAGILSSLRIRTARMAVLNRLAEEIGETCNIALPDRDCMLYLDRVETTWPLRIQLPVGTRVPLHCTASGKMYLSTLSEHHLSSYLRTTPMEKRTGATLIDPDAIMSEMKAIRTQGYSVDNEEFMEGMIAVGVAIDDADGRLVSTLSFHAPVQRLSLDDALLNLDRLKAAARDLSSILID